MILGALYGAGKWTDLAIEGDAVEDRSPALPSGVGGNKRPGVANALVYGGRGNAGEASFERDWDAAAADVAVSAPDAVAVAAVDGDGEGWCERRVVSDATTLDEPMVVAANVGDAGGEARSIGLASVPKLLAG